MSEPRLLRIFENADLRCAQDGLTELAKRHVDASKIKPGELLVFINTDRTMVKVLASTGYGLCVTGYRSPSGRLELRALRHLPAAFRGGELHYDKALAKTLAEILPEKRLRSAKKTAQ